MASLIKNRHLHRSFATLSIIFVECVVFVLSTSFWPLIQVMDLVGFGYSGFVEGSQFWTPLTSLFIHVSIYHLLINMFLLYVFGTALESSKGSRFFLLTFFLGGAASLFIGVPLYSEATRIVGSSIAVSAVIGAVLATTPFKPSPIFLFKAPLGLIAVIYFIFNAFFAFYGQTTLGIAYPSHIIGFMVGVGFGLMSQLVLQHRGSRIEN